VGHEAEAMRDYTAAVAAMGMERQSDRAERDVPREPARAPSDGSDGAPPAAES
jgi:hypothetical protein